jgi:HK97 family phage portal protein
MFGKKRKALEAQVESLISEVGALKNEISITDSQAFKEMFMGGASGRLSVNETTAMRCSAVFACVRLIAGAIASASVRIYRREDEGKRVPSWNHPYRKMLASWPNDHITAATFWKTMAANKVLNGGAFAPIIRSRSGRPLALVPLNPKRCAVYQAWERGLDTMLGVEPDRLYYLVTWDNGTTSFIDQDDMIHVPNIGWDGKNGLSTIKAGAQSVGLALSAEESASSLFENGLVSQTAITFEKKMDADQQELLRQHFVEKHASPANHHKPLIITQGGDIKALSMNAGDAQLLETRQFSVIDICRFFGVPPVMVGESEKTSSWGSGVEQMARWFVMFTLNDHFTDIEQELEKKLFRSSDHFCKFDEDELTRGDTKTQGEYFKAAVGGTQNPGWMTQNEVREVKNLPPIDGGDVLYVPKGKGDEERQQGENDEQ